MGAWGLLPSGSTIADDNRQLTNLGFKTSSAHPGGVPPRVARVDEINGHRLTYAEARENPHAQCWRVTSSERAYGHWRVTFDDPVFGMKLGLYLPGAASRGGGRINLLRKGGGPDGLLKSEWRPMKGTTALSRERLLAKIDEPKTYRKKARKGDRGRVAARVLAPREARRRVHAE